MHYTIINIISWFLRLYFITAVYLFVIFEHPFYVRVSFRTLRPKTADPGHCCQTLPSSVPCRLFPFRAPSRYSASRRYACTPGNPDVAVACRRCFCTFTVCVSVRPIGPAPTSHVIPVLCPASSRSWAATPTAIVYVGPGSWLWLLQLTSSCHVFCEWLTDCWWLSRISWRWERRKYFSTKFTISVRKSEGKDGHWGTKFAGFSGDMMSTWFGVIVLEIKHGYV